MTAAPADLGEHGRALYASVADALELYPGEDVILYRAAAVADTLAELDAAIRRDGAVLTYTTAHGSTKRVVNPAVDAARANAALLASLLRQIGVHADDDAPAVPVPIRYRATRAAR